MMSSIDYNRIKDLFSRLFVLAVRSKMNSSSFTRLLGKSDVVTKIEKGVYDEYFNKPIGTIFSDISGSIPEKDESFGVYDDAYWCGASYFELHDRLKLPFSYLFLKLPLPHLMDIYAVYHEMDISSLEEHFREAEAGKTILRALCEEKGCSLSKLSTDTGISKNTLMKYNADDRALRSGSFQNVWKIAMYFDVPVSLFAI